MSIYYQCFHVDGHGLATIEVLRDIEFWQVPYNLLSDLPKNTTCSMHNLELLLDKNESIGSLFS